MQDPKTQAELLEYAKEGCNIFAVRAVACAKPQATLKEQPRVAAHLHSSPQALVVSFSLSVLPPQDFKDQCEQYVTLYGPLVFNMLISYLQPDSVCTRMGYCSASPPLVVT